MLRANAKHRASYANTARASDAYAECLCFFFQAEDGIRDLTVTGVQTCALPISPGFVPEFAQASSGEIVIRPGCWIDWSSAYTVCRYRCLCRKWEAYHIPVNEGNPDRKSVV